MTEDHLADAGGEDKLSVAARKLGSDPYRVAPRALAAMFGCVSAINQAAPRGGAAERALEILLGFDALLDVLDRRVRSGLVLKASLDERATELSGSEFLVSEGALDGPAIERALALRHAAKRAKDFRAADTIREGLRERGVVIEDAAQGVRWKQSD
jgi:cysteinyl-tRNA synthetase